MILPSERARLKLSSCAGCDGTCACEACSKSKTAAAAVVGEVLVAIKDHESVYGEEIAAGTKVKIHNLASGNRAWVIEEVSPNRWYPEDQMVLVNLHEFRRWVKLDFSGWKGFMNISGFNGDGKRIVGPVMFDPEFDAARLAHNYRMMADLIEEFAANPRLARVSIGGS